MGTRTYTVIVSGNGLMFYPLPVPVRLLDTCFGASPNACSQPNAPIAGGTSRTQPARSFCGLPANAQAITGNVTTVQSGGGYLTLYPSDAAQPIVASTNYGPNEIINNVFTVGLGATDGAFNIFALSTTDVVVDVTGYYAPPTGGCTSIRSPHLCGCWKPEPGSRSVASCRARLCRAARIRCKRPPAHAAAFRRRRAPSSATPRRSAHRAAAI